MSAAAKVIAALVVALCAGCLREPIDSANAPHSAAVEDTLWIPVGENLYSNAQGDLGFRIDYVVHNARKTRTRYLTHFDFDDELALAGTVDVATFRQLADSNFYKDANHIYQYYDMAEGGRISLFDKIEPGVDHESFEVLNEFYARDDRSIYGYRRGWVKEADASTFVVLGDGPAAKDRNGYFLWGEPATAEEITDRLGAVPAGRAPTRK